MLRFANIDFLWGLAAIPVLLLIFWRVSAWKKKAISSLGDLKVVGLMISDVSFSRPWIKFIFFLLGFAFLIVGMADPQIGSKLDEAKRTGSEVMVLLDVSNSMLAQDLAPNRLESAKRSISQLIDSLHGDRLGIIVFAGQAYVQLPVTTDYSAAKLFLNTINTDIVPTQGTAIGTAIDLGLQSLDFKNGLSKAMIIITDGENHEDDAISAAKSALEKEVTIHVVGVGSPEGAPIPIYQDGKQTGFHLDSAGNSVVSKLNEEMCKEIASAGGGAYIRASNANGGLGIVMDQIEKMNKKMFGTKMFKDYEDRFQIFLVLALIAFAIEFFISNRKNLKLDKLKLFEVKS